MAHYCKVPMCNRRDSKAMFTFPGKTSPALVNWKLACKIPEGQAIPTSYRVCYKHFASHKIEAKLKLEYSLKDKDGKFKFDH